MYERVRGGSWVVAIKPKFDYADQFRDGLAPVEISHRTSFINKTGKVVIKHSNKREFHYGSSCHRILIHTKDGAGYISTSGKLIVKPQYDYAEVYSDNRAVVGKNSLYGVIDEQGNIVVPISYKYIGTYGAGLCPYKEDDLFGYLDLRGKVAIKPQFVRASDFLGGFAKTLKPNRKTGGYINCSGVELFNFRKFDSIGVFSEGIAPVQIHGLWGYCDTEGTVVIEPSFIRALPFKSGLAPVQVDVNRYVYIDAYGRTTIEKEFSEARPFCEGVAAVRHMYKWGFINTLGNYVVEPQFIDVGECSENYAPAMWYHGVGYIEFF